MGLRAKPLPFIPEAGALVHPFRGPAPLCDRGIPFLDMRTRRIFWFHPWALKTTKQIVAPSFMFNGTLGSGKSAALKAIGALLSGFQAGIDDDGNPRLMRVRFHDRKPEGDEGQGEFAPITRELRGTVVDLNQRGLINIFDSKLVGSYMDLVEIGGNVAEQILGMSPLPRYMPVALQVGIWKMLKVAPDATSVGLLESVLRKLDIVDVNEYYDTIDDKIYEGRLELLDQLNLRVNKPYNVDEQEFLSDARKVAGAFHELLYGRFGGVFGDDNSLYDLFSQRITLFNWYGVNDAAASVAESVFMKWQITARTLGDLNTIPHMEFGDEEHGAMRRLMHVRFYSQLIKEARAFETARFLSTQAEEDITAAGDADSEIVKTSQGILRGIGGRFIGQLPRSDETLRWLRGLGISRPDADIITSEAFPTGCFALKLSKRPDTLFLQLLLGPRMLELLRTDSASERMSESRPVSSFESFRRRAAAAGIHVNSDSNGG